MLILVLIDVQYSQKASFGFEKGSVCQNHSSSGSQCPIKKPYQQNSQSTSYSLLLFGKLIEIPTVLCGNCYFKRRKFTLQLNQTYYCQQ